MTELIGRRAECGTLGRPWRQCGPGTAVPWCVHGEPGVGKTVLLDYLVGQAPDCRLVRAVAWSSIPSGRPARRPGRRTAAPGRAAPVAPPALGCRPLAGHPRRQLPGIGTRYARATGEDLPVQLAQFGSWLGAQLVDTASGQGTSLGYINDLGQVTGSYTESNGDSVAFAGPIGKFTTVSDPVAPAFSTLTAAINDAGVVVGEWFDANATFHGFRAAHGVSTPIEDPAGTEGTHVDGISNRGVIVGFSVDSSGNFHGFELSPVRQTSVPGGGPPGGLVILSPM